MHILAWLKHKWYIAKQVKGHVLSEKHFSETEGYRKLSAYIRSKVPPGKVLDVGCNTGFESLLLEHEGKKVVGIDIGEEYVAVARSRGIEAYQMDFHKLDFEPFSFDAIYWNNGIEHARFPIKALLETFLVLKEGGKLIGCLPSDYRNPDYKGGEGWNSSLHYWSPTPQELRQYLSFAGFINVKIEEVDALKKFNLQNLASKNHYIIFEGAKAFSEV